MNPRALLPWLFVAATALGCAPTWHVVTQASPEAFRGHPSFALLPIDYTGLHVGRQTEDEFLSQKTDQQRQSFAADKAGLDEQFRAELVTDAREAGVEVTPAAGPGEGLSIQPSIGALELGVDGVPGAAHSRVEMRVRILSAGGIVLDDITLSQGAASLSGVGVAEVTPDASSGSRLRRDGEQLGKAVAAYLRSRVASSARSDHPAARRSRMACTIFT